MRRFLRSAGLSVVILIFLCPAVVRCDHPEDKKPFFTSLIALLLLDFSRKTPCERDPNFVNHLVAGQLWDSTSPSSKVQTSSGGTTFAYLLLTAASPIFVNMNTNPGVVGRITLYAAGLQWQSSESEDPVLNVSGLETSPICVVASARSIPTSFQVRVD